MLAMAKATKHKGRQNIRHAADERDPVTGEIIAEVVDVEDPDNPNRRERVRRIASPLRRLRGLPDEAFDAGRRFEDAYVASRMGPRYCMTNADRIMVDVSVRNVEQLVSDSMAAQECAAAIEAMGELGGSILTFVIGQQMTVEEWCFKRARMNRWGAGLTPQGAGWVLRQVLGSLAQFYRWYDRGYYKPLRPGN